MGPSLFCTRRNPTVVEHPQPWYVNAHFPHASSEPPCAVERAFLFAGAEVRALRVGIRGVEHWVGWRMVCGSMYQMWVSAAQQTNNHGTRSREQRALGRPHLHGLRPQATVHPRLPGDCGWAGAWFRGRGRLEALPQVRESPIAMPGEPHLGASRAPGTSAPPPMFPLLVLKTSHTSSWGVWTWGIAVSGLFFLSRLLFGVQVMEGTGGRQHRQVGG
eukprot:COSAG01_NODE_211_length_21847_cov_17.992781_3_plen_217_part_00